jgi:cytoskeletal protein RodZ
MRESLSKQKAIIYFTLSFIVIVSFLIFYISCKSKSPTDSTSALNGLVANQSTNNTTTSSSTTTTIKPGNSPPNTTTIITSRNLTTTTSSISTSTTSSPTTTTSRGYIRLEWCSVTANGKEISNGDIVGAGVSHDPNEPVYTIIGISVRNVGNTPAENLKFTLTQLPSFMSCAHILDGFNTIRFINDKGKCENSPQAFLIRTNVITSIAKFKIQGEYGLPPFYFEVWR